MTCSPSHDDLPGRLQPRPTTQPVRRDGYVHGHLPQTSATAVWAESPSGDRDRSGLASAKTAGDDLTVPDNRDDTTPRRLLLAGSRAFSSMGVEGASLLAITDAAGQRNRSAVHYHFGSRDRFLAAVLGLHAERWRRREQELLSEVPEGAAGLTAVIEAMVRPPVELSAHRPGRDHLAIVNELLASDPTTLDSDVSEALEHARHTAALELVATRVPVETPAANFRLSMTVLLIQQALLARSRAIEYGDPATTAQDPEEYVRLLTAMALPLVTSAAGPAAVENRSASRT